MEHNIENLILELLSIEIKITHAVNSGRGVNTISKRQDKILEELSEKLNLDIDYLKKEIEK